MLSVTQDIRFPKIIWCPCPRSCTLKTERFESKHLLSYLLSKSLNEYYTIIRQFSGYFLLHAQNMFIVCVKSTHKAQHKHLGHSTPTHQAVATTPSDFTRMLLEWLVLMKKEGLPSRLAIKGSLAPPQTWSNFTQKLDFFDFFSVFQ